jgi:peptidoglycan/LPS O-acetylase OafA/YrhL
LEWIKYLAANLTFLNFLHPTLPHVFSSQAIDAINGALWTLKIEVMFYATVPLIVYLFKRCGRMPVLITLYVLSFVYSWTTTQYAQSTGSSFWLLLSHQFPAQLDYFLSGALLYYYKPLFKRWLPLCFLGSMIFFVLQLHYLVYFFQASSLGCFCHRFGSV